MAEGGFENVPSRNTLVKYNNPVLVVTHAEKRPATAGPLGSPTSCELSPRGKTSPGIIVLPGVSESRKEAEEILNSVLPPKCWEEDGQMWMQTVSSTPATRQDVINLQEMLDTRLQQTQARETGICPVRRELYMQCFDELIRQVTINCTERGLLLLRVRDEIAMSMEAYETLYCSSVAFGMRKALQAQEGKESLQLLVTVLQAEKKVLENTISDMKIKADQVERRNAELRASEEKKHAEEIAFLKKTSAQLKAQLEGIIAPKK
uniref:Putative axonemal dynein light chain n=2 Tax=Nyssomyia neivai TaxID=330878 RepID=A0A1L8E507_9DIPT